VYELFLLADLDTVISAGTLVQLGSGVRKWRPKGRN